MAKLKSYLTKDDEKLLKVLKKGPLKDDDQDDPDPPDYIATDPDE